MQTWRKYEKRQDNYIKKLPLAVFKTRGSLITNLPSLGRRIYENCPANQLGTNKPVKLLFIQQSASG